MKSDHRARKFSLAGVALVALTLAAAIAPGPALARDGAVADSFSALSRAPSEMAIRGLEQNPSESFLPRDISENFGSDRFHHICDECNFRPSPVPEPGSASLLIAGLLTICVFVVHRRPRR